MRTFINSAATSQAVNHLSQLISRIGHPNQSSHALITVLLEKIFHDYPDATLWKIGSVVHSANELRKSRATTLLNKVTARDKACDIDVSLT
jgi:serine/threonine-protein kinase ATR